MKIMLVGGGSGGHITPLLAIAGQIKKMEPSSEFVYVGHRGDKLGRVVVESPLVSESHMIFAGKFRRYHGAGWRQVLDVKTILKNVRDFMYLLLGLLQSLVIIGRSKPDVIFIKGGFVGVPVGKAARFFKIPYITHDSDALPGLANRLIAKHAHAHAVALPKELYTSYPTHKTFEVGVPVAESFKKADVAAVTAARKQLEIKEKATVLLVIGGGLGAKRLNHAVIAASSKLIDTFPNLVVLHVAGGMHEDETARAYRRLLATGVLGQFRVYGFTDKVAELETAADVVVTRAGATALAELAALAKPVIMVPNPILTGGHQLKNAVAYADRDAAIVIQEKELDKLGQKIEELLKDRKKQHTLAENLHKFARGNAAEEVAKLVLEAAKAK